MKHNRIKIKEILLSLVTLSSTTLAIALQPQEASFCAVEQVSTELNSLSTRLENQISGDELLRKENLKNLITAQISRYGAKEKINPYLSLVNDLYFSNKKGPVLLRNFVASIMAQMNVLGNTTPSFELQLSLFAQLEEAVSVLNYYAKNYSTHVIHSTFSQSGLTESEYKLACDFWNLDLYSHLFLSDDTVDESIPDAVPDAALEQVLNLAIQDAAKAKIECLHNDARYILLAYIIYPNIPLNIRADFLQMLKNNSDLSPRLIAESIFYSNIEFVQHRDLPTLKSFAFKINIAIQDSIKHAISQVSGLSKADQADLLKEATIHLQPLVKYWFENKVLDLYGSNVGIKLNEGAPVMGFGDTDIQNDPKLGKIARFCHAAVEWQPFKGTKTKKKNESVNPLETTETMNKLAFHFFPNSGKYNTSSFLTLCYYSMTSFKVLHGFIKKKIDESVMLHSMQLHLMNMLPTLPIDDEQTILAYNSSPIDISSNKKKAPLKKKKKAKKGATNTTSLAPVSPVKTGFDTTAFQALSKLNPGVVSDTTLDEFNAPVVEVPIVKPAAVEKKVESKSIVEEEVVLKSTDASTVDIQVIPEEVDASIATLKKESTSEDAQTDDQHSQVDDGKTSIDHDSLSQPLEVMSAPQFPERQESKEELSELTVSTHEYSISVPEQIVTYESGITYPLPAEAFFPFPVVYVGIPYIVTDVVKRPYFLPVLPNDKAVTCLKNEDGVRFTHSWILQDKFDTKLYAQFHNRNANDYEVSQCEYCGMIAQSLTQEAAERLSA